ncbi:hypothetical protein [Tepidibacter mesophilus]|uniref:hypothetical protein n=1 Tax=Tepidibacter mesophilus TaxID=655607 RepID=UPI000C0770A3|nr:hypothetical protein [Tepidibacter mesophilus]
MEGILIPALIYVISIVFKAFFKDEDEGTENKNTLLKNVNNTVKKIENNLNELSYNYKKQKHIKESKEEYVDEDISTIFTEDIEAKQDPKNIDDYINQEQNLNKDYDKNSKSMNSDEGFDLFSDSDDLMKAIIMSEILSKPKSIKR